jgi:peptidoglycan/LPS O-acetylase OafA/YrhL
MDRLRELDFLRGIAIVLVLFRHSPVFWPLTNMGWMGVDLFFVLSGFLISGLLFKEYQKFGNIKGFHFLVRRAFKIYPVYYIALPMYLMAALVSGHVSTFKVLAEVLFMQNFANGWGYLSPPSWSLAVEEHFYFGLVLVFSYLIARNIFNPEPKEKLGNVEKGMMAAMGAVLVLRVTSNLLMPAQIVRNFTLTPLRIDALMAGVLVSFLYYFKRDYLARVFQGPGKFSILAALALLAWTPFIEPVGSLFAETLGFTTVYSAYALVLVYFLMDKKVNVRLDRLFSKRVVNIVSKIGVYSYSIYVFHYLVNIIVRSFYQGAFVSYICIPLDLIVGVLVSLYVENYFLRLRDKHFPSRLKETASIGVKNRHAQTRVETTPSIVKDGISLDSMDARASST